MNDRPKDNDSSVTRRETEAALATRVPAATLRWRCPEDIFEFDTTEEIEPIDNIVAQETAREALDFALASTARSQNVYVRGVRGTGRRTMVRQLLSTQPRAASQRADRCFVHNFKQPDRPKLISLAPGMGRVFRRRMRGLAEFVEKDLPRVLESDPLKSDIAALEAKIQQQITEISGPLENDLEAANMKLVTLQQGPMPVTLIFPIVEGEPVPPGQLKQMVAQGKAEKKQLEAFEEQVPGFQKRLQEVAIAVTRSQRSGIDSLQELTSTAVRKYLETFVAEIREDFNDVSVQEFLGDVIDDVVETKHDQETSLVDLYGVNIVLEHGLDDSPPIVEETSPTVSNLLGTIDVTWDRSAPSQVDYTGIHAGALLRADGGYLILDVHDLLAEPGSWRALTRTLRSGFLEITPPDVPWFRSQSLLNPEKIPIDVRVILIGDGYVYRLLDSSDPDFGDLFKVLADFDSEIERNEEGILHYAAVIARMAREEGLLHFDRSAVAALTEHGARVVSRPGKLTARFGRIGDLAREASFLARRQNAEHVTGENVVEAVRRTKRRASLPSTKFQQLIRSGTIRVETEGDVVGQINGLAVISAGPIVYGFPARITASIGVGRSGIVDIESSASLSGSIHTKGFHILNGLLRHLIKADHPLAFSASLAFEQSYGGIDGDSASGAEICCLISALTDVPIRQCLAMTGAIDQHGHIQAIGGVNEKVEGFFDTCAHFGLTGCQGVVIPSSNAGDLMLRTDIVEACERGEFSIHAVDTVHQALEVLTGIPAGEATVNDDGTTSYPDGTLLAIAVDRANDFWVKANAPATRNGNSNKSEQKPDSQDPN